MKKNLLFVGFATAMMVACSTVDDELLTQQTALQEEDEEYELSLKNLYVAESDVPITFSIDKNSKTRASVSESPFIADEVGIFCVSRKPIDGVSAKANWAQTGSATANKLRIWQKNTPATIVKKEGSDDSELKWADGVEEHFYPAPDVSLKYGYSFIGYHPYTDTLRYNTSSIQAVFFLDGNDDIITSVTEAPTDGNDTGFSAAYFKTEGGTKKPHFTFDHRMSRLDFTVCLKAGSGVGNIFTVDSLWIERVPNSIIVTLATLNTTDNTVLPSTAITIATSWTGTYWLRESDDSSIRKGNYELSETPLAIGDCIMIPPIQEACFSSVDKYNQFKTLNVRVRLRDADRQIYTLKTTVAPPTNGWKQGKRYPINIVANPVNPTDFEMEATARIQPWTDDADAFTTDNEAGE